MHRNTSILVFLVLSSTIEYGFCLLRWIVSDCIGLYRIEMHRALAALQTSWSSAQSV